MQHVAAGLKESRELVRRAVLLCAVLADTGDKLATNWNAMYRVVDDSKTTVSGKR